MNVPVFLQIRAHRPSHHLKINKLSWDAKLVGDGVNPPFQEIFGMPRYVPIAPCCREHKRLWRSVWAHLLPGFNDWPNVFRNWYCIPAGIGLNFAGKQLSLISGALNDQFISAIRLPLQTESFTRASGTK